MKTIKSFGKFDVCQQSKAEGPRPYCVMVGNAKLENFARYARAVRFARKRRDEAAVYETVIPKMP